MDPIINDLLNALIVGLVPVVIGALGYLANEVIKLIQANVSKEQYAMLEKIRSRLRWRSSEASAPSVASSWMKKPSATL